MPDLTLRISSLPGPNYWCQLEAADTQVPGDAGDLIIGRILGLTTAGARKFTVGRPPPPMQ